MDANEYQAKTRLTAIYPAASAIPYTILGLTNEAGEVAGKYKKFLRDGLSFEEMRNAVIDELGDTLWYASQLASELQIDLSEVMERNLAKLAGRAERGTLGGSGDKR